MSDLNRVILIGRLTRDAALKFTNSGLAICTFSIAVNRRVKQNDQWTDEAHFFDITLFGKLGEAIVQYLTKGQQVAVEAHLQQDRWVDQETGKNRTKISIIAENLQLLGGKRDAAGQTEGDTGRAPEPQKPAGEQGAFEDDIPF